MQNAQNEYVCGEPETISTLSTENNYQNLCAYQKFENTKRTRKIEATTIETKTVAYTTWLAADHRCV